MIGEGVRFRTAALLLVVSWFMANYQHTTTPRLRTKPKSEQHDE